MATPLQVVALIRLVRFAHIHSGMCTFLAIRPEKGKSMGIIKVSGMSDDDLHNTSVHPAKNWIIDHTITMTLIFWVAGMLPVLGIYLVIAH